MYTLSGFFCDGQLSISFNLLTGKSDSKNICFQNENLSNQTDPNILTYFEMRNFFVCFVRSLDFQIVNANICKETALKLPQSQIPVIFKEVIP